MYVPKCKYVNNLVEVDLTKELIPLTRHFRNSHAKSFRIPYEKKTYLQYSFLPRTIKQWNSLPATLATAPSLNFFKSGVRELKLRTFTNLIESEHISLVERECLCSDSSIARLGCLNRSGHTAPAFEFVNHRRCHTNEKRGLYPQCPSCNVPEEYHISVFSMKCV